MNDDFIYSWRVKAVLCAVLLPLFVMVDRWIANYADAEQEGALTRVVCVGTVVDIQTGDIVYRRGKPTLIGTIAESDMSGGIVLIVNDEEIELTTRNLLRVIEDQDQALTIRIDTWPKELREAGYDFRNNTKVVGNRFQGQLDDHVYSIGDKLFMELPLKRTDDIDRVIPELRGYFRNTFLWRLIAVLGLSLILVGGVKGLLTIFATVSSLALLMLVFVPGLLGATAEAGRSGFLIIGFLALAAGVVWIVQRWRSGRGRIALPMLGVAAAAVAAGILTEGSVVLIGARPLPLALFVSLVITLATFTIITGFSAKVISGSLGTVGGLLACGLISWIASKSLWFTGLAVEFGYTDLGAVLWRDDTSNPWPFLDFLSAGLIIAALGAMMDVSMSVSSTIYEVKKANPNISVVGAMRAGYNVGKDIMSTMTDTLIFAFIGADLVFIVMPGLDFGESGRLYPFMRILNEEDVAVEAVHALMGTLGLTLAIPISAFIAGLLTARFVPTGEAAETAEEGETP